MFEAFDLSPKYHSTSTFWGNTCKAYNILDLITLLIPPSSEECHLNIDKCSALINLQLLNDCVQDVLHCSMLDAVVACNEQSVWEWETDKEHYGVNTHMNVSTPCSMRIEAEYNRATITALHERGQINLCE